MNWAPPFLSKGQKIFQKFRIRSRSLRYSLTLWYVGMLSVVLCVFSVSLYTIVAARLNRDVNKALVLQARRVSDTIYAFWRAERVSLAGPGNWQSAPPATLLRVVYEGQLRDLVERWSNETDGLRREYPIRLVDRKGRIFAESLNFKEIQVSPTPLAITKARERHSVYETLKFKDRRERLVTYPVIEEGHLLYFVQVASSLEQIDISLKRIILVLLFLTPFALVVTSVIGWFLASRALQPVVQVITQAQRIGIEHLDERIDVAETKDELEQLGVTFNDMLVRIEEGFKRMRQFSAAASHELRTPLTVMKGELEVTLRKPRTPEKYQRVLRTQLDAIDELTRIVETLLTLARSGAVGGRIEWRPVELSEIAIEASEDLNPLAKAKAIQLQVETPAPVWVRGEQRLLERLVANLLDNAIRHTPSRGCVTVQPERKGNMACLIVRDTGPGIPPEELPHIFDRFFKPPSPFTHPPSSGLGLGLCRWIVEAHHGRIKVDSIPGEGATFTILLPLLQTPL